MTTYRARGYLPAVLYDFPTEFSIAVGQQAVAAMVLFAPSFGFYLVPGGALTVVFAVIVWFSGALTMVGLVAYRRHWHVGVEQLGLWLTSATFLSYASLILAGNAWGSVFSFTLFLVIGLSSALRAYGLRVKLRRRLQELEVTRELREEASRHGPDHLAV